MATFQFVARDPQGRVARGTEAAPTAQAAIAALRDRGLKIIDVQPAENSGEPLSAQLAKARPSQWLPVRSIDVEISLAQLATMLRGGLTLLTCLSNVAEQTQRASMRRVWHEVARRLQAGSSFADALQQHRCFPLLVIQLVRIGEQTGNLEPVLKRGAETMERRRGLRNTLLTALSYPMLVLIAAMSVTAFMVLNVIPKLEVFLNQLGKELPPMTQRLLDVSAIIRQHAVVGVVVAASIAACAVVTYTAPSGRLWTDRWILRLPIIGNLVRLASTALVARSLGMLLQSGVTLLEGLRTVEGLPHNSYLRSRLESTRDKVLQGDTLADGLRDPHAFLPMLSAMSAVGESSGTLDVVLEDTARFHEEQLQVAIRRFSLLIEPAIVFVVGSIVGYVYIAFFVAMFAAGSPGAS